MKDEINTQKTDEGLAGARYGSAVGWDPGRKFEEKRARERRALRRREPEKFCFEGMLSVKRARDWMKRDPERRPLGGQLLGELWREGEVAMLVGEPGVGKSIFAMHLAEAIARGEYFAPFGRAKRRLRVKYLDLRQSPEQFKGRYTSWGDRGQSARYAFSARLERCALSEAVNIPDDFRGDLRRYFAHSINLAITASDLDVLVVDDLANYVTRKGPDAHARAMRSLRLMAVTHGISILVLANARPASGEPVTLRSVLEGTRAAAHADSVFALGKSGSGGSLRYLKHLKSASGEILRGKENVAVLGIERAANARELVRRGRDIKGELPSAGKHAAPVTFKAIAPVVTPFIGFRYQGDSTEAEQLRDVHEERRRHEARLEMHARAVELAALEQVAIANQLYESLRLRAKARDEDAIDAEVVEVADASK